MMIDRTDDPQGALLSRERRILWSEELGCPYMGEPVQEVVRRGAQED